MSETTLKDDVRQMTGYTSTQVLSDDGLDTAYRKAKEHIRIEKGLANDLEWFTPENDAAAKALFWYTCLFSKVQTGDLDAQQFQAGAIDREALLAKDDDAVTTWYRNAQRSLESVNGTSIIASAAPSRGERAYSRSGYNVPRGGTGGTGGGGNTGGPSLGSQ